MDPLAFYSKPGKMTDPGKYAYLLEGLPDDLASLCSVVQGDMIHVFWAGRMEVNLTESQKSTLQIRPVSEKLARMAEVDGRPLDVPRPPDRRQVGNCRDFTLLLVSMLRHKGVPARARCGFATYFGPDHYEDHWVCEHWDDLRRRWVMGDSQLDPFQRKVLNIGFDPLDVPPDAFLTAGRAWTMCRSGEADPDKFGIGDLHGLWFVWDDVVRDFLALNKVEILPWDGGWGFMTQGTSPLPDADVLAQYDRLASLTLEVNKRFPEIRAYYEGEPRFRTPSEWGLQDEWHAGV